MSPPRYCISMACGDARAGPDAPLPEQRFFILEPWCTHRVHTCLSVQKARASRGSSHPESSVERGGSSSAERGRKPRAPAPTVARRPAGHHAFLPDS
eukprot:5579328-Pyramimonas_sp.AAC.1